MKEFYNKKIYDMYIINKEKRNAIKKKKINLSISNNENTEKNSRNNDKLYTTSSCKKININSKTNNSFHNIFNKEKYKKNNKFNRSLDNNSINHKKNFSFHSKIIFNNLKNFQNKKNNVSISPINKKNK